MNHVLDELEELMLTVEHHDMSIFLLAMAGLLLLVLIFLVAYRACTNHNDIRRLDNRVIEGHNELAKRLLEQEQAPNRVRRTGVNNFRLTCKVGVEAGVLPESAVREALGVLKNKVGRLKILCIPVCPEVKGFYPIKLLSDDINEFFWQDNIV